MIEFEDPRVEPARIKVVGVGGGGGNAVATMLTSGILPGVEFIVANTDMQALSVHNAPVKIQLGPQLNRGLGAGANPEMGREAANESLEQLTQGLYGADMIFITAGMGGGTGTGAAPIIAHAAKQTGALTVAVVTKPFEFEGARRMRQAEEGIFLLREEVDALIVIPNSRLLEIIGNRTPVKDAFTKVDEVLLNAVAGIAEVINIGGLVNVDFADVRTIMSGTGPALMGTGRATGENRALEAAKKAISSPLLENVSIEGASGLLINVTGSSNLGLWEVEQAVNMVKECTCADAQVIFGAVMDESMNEEVKVTVIATGLNTNIPNNQYQAYRSPSSVSSSQNRNWTERVPSQKKSIDLGSGHMNSMSGWPGKSQSGSFPIFGSQVQRPHQQQPMQSRSNTSALLQGFGGRNLSESGAYQVPIQAQDNFSPYGRTTAWSQPMPDPIFGSADAYRQRTIESQVENLNDNDGGNSRTGEFATGTVNRERRWSQSGQGMTADRSSFNSPFAMEPVSQTAVTAAASSATAKGTGREDDFDLIVDRIDRVEHPRMFKLKR